MSPAAGEHTPRITITQETNGAFLCTECEAYNDEAQFSRRKAGVVCQVCGILTRMTLAEFTSASDVLLSTGMSPSARNQARWPLPPTTDVDIERAVNGGDEDEENEPPQIMAKKEHAKVLPLFLNVIFMQGMPWSCAPSVTFSSVWLQATRTAAPHAAQPRAAAAEHPHVPTISLAAPSIPNSTEVSMFAASPPALPFAGTCPQVLGEEAAVALSDPTGTFPLSGSQESAETYKQRPQHGASIAVSAPAHVYKRRTLKSSAKEHGGPLRQAGVRGETVSCAQAGTTSAEGETRYLLAGVVVLILITGLLLACSLWLLPTSATSVAQANTKGGGLLRTLWKRPSGHDKSARFSLSGGKKQMGRESEGLGDMVLAEAQAKAALALEQVSLAVEDVSDLAGVASELASASLADLSQAASEVASASLASVGVDRLLGSQPRTLKEPTVKKRGVFRRMFPLLKEKNPP